MLQMSAAEHKVTVVSLKNTLDLRKASGKKKEKKKGGREEGEKMVYFSVFGQTTVCSKYFFQINNLLLLFSDK